jgi:hypothetical protein
MLHFLPPKSCQKRNFFLYLGVAFKGSLKCYTCIPNKPDDIGLNEVFNNSAKYCKGSEIRSKMRFFWREGGFIK